MDRFKKPLPDWWRRLAQAGATLALSTSLVLAQDNQGTAAPRLGYHSVLNDYQAFNEQALTPWQQANELVEKIGGWRVYAKEARQAGSPSEASANSAAKPAESPSGKSASQSHHGSQP